MKKLNYIGNAQIVSFSDLPRIGAEHKIYNKSICIELKIIDFKEDFIIYQAKFCEKDSLHILDDFYINCSSWTYAVKKNVYREKWSK